MLDQIYMSATPELRINGFQIGAPLGRGGFSVVFSARQNSDDAPTAMKVGLASTPELRARFAREARILERIGPPCAPALYATGQVDDGRPWIAMERLFGRTLAEAIAAPAESRDLAWTLRHADALLAALETVHARGLVHRDLKPENVFLPNVGSRAGSVALLDFGLTRETTPDATDVTRAGAIVGTPLYCAPEQMSTPGDAGALTDIYAFGVILFEMLTSRPPFLGDTSAIEHGHLALRPPRPSQFAVVPEAIEVIVLACLAKDPRRRPRSVVELRRALGAQSGQEVPPPLSTGLSPGRFGGAKILEEARQPAVLMLADTRAAMPAVVAAITSRKGIIARQRGSRYIAAFCGRGADHPALIAHGVAQEIVGRFAGRAALRLSNVTLRRRERGPTLVSGVDVDHPEKWAPPEPWSGIVVSDDVGRMLSDVEPPSTKRAPSIPGTDVLLQDIEAPLLGRDKLSADLEQSAERALVAGRTSLFTVIGDTGLGKSRISVEAVEIALRREPAAVVIALRPVAPGNVSREAVDLLNAALDAPSSPPPDIEAFCQERLGPVVGAGTWAAVGATLGWREPIESALLQRGLVRALAEGLRRRARLRPLAVIMDDAHRADDLVLDALEAATLDGEDIKLWVVVTAHPRLTHFRPGWGARTQRFNATTLGPLDDAAAAEMAAELLRPAEYPPADVLTMLSRWSGGNPGCLTEIVRALKRSGVVHRRPQTGSHYVATADLERLPASPAWQWLAGRSLDALAPDLAACARLCAAIGASFTRAELDWVQDAADREGDANTPIEASFGLSMLVEHKILRRSGRDRYTFATRMIRDAIVATLDPAHLRAIHRHALSYWRARVELAGATHENLASLAQHAGACGASEVAADAYLELGARALARHRHVEADNHFTAALDLGAGPLQRARALLGRGRCRYRLHRAREAVEDLEGARAAAVDLGDDARRAEILLEEATALDWAGSFEASALRVAEAAEIIARSGDPGLESRLLVGEGRTRMRQGRIAEAVEMLARVATGPGAAADHDTRMVALMILPVALVISGRLDEAEDLFQEAIDLAVEAEDWSHLCALYGNRCFLWAARKDLRSASEDMSRALPLAREIGNPLLERTATLNVAELLYWEGRYDEARGLASRALTLDERFLERPAAESSLVLARILIALSADVEAARRVDWVAASCPPDERASSKRTLFRMLQRVLCERGAALACSPEASWDEVLGEARGRVLDLEMLELLYWYSRMAIRRERWVEIDAAMAEAEPLLREFPIWRSRFEALRGMRASVRPLA